MRAVRRASSLGLLVAALMALTACASDGPTTAKALFRAPTYSGTGGGWYAADAAVDYRETGTAGWYRETKGRGRLTAWISRKLGKKGKTQPAPTYVAVTGSAHLPIPSVVEITNLANGQKLRVRVEQRAQMKGRIISLPESAARQLGSDLKSPLRVSARYVAPVMVMREAPTLRYAKARPKPLPKAVPAPAPVEVAAAPPPPAVAPPALAASRPAVAAAGTTPIPSGAPFRVQAAAFASRDNAERAAARLASAGPASIEPLDRNGVTLFRVVVRGPTDEARARVLQAKVVDLGFADARLLRPS